MAQDIKNLFAGALVLAAVGFLGWRAYLMSTAPKELPDDDPHAHLMRSQPGLKVLDDKTVVDIFGKAIGYEGPHGELVNAKGQPISRTGEVLPPRDSQPATQSAQDLASLVRGPDVPIQWTLKGHRSGVMALAFSPDERLLASAGADGDVRLWDLSTRKLVRTIPTGTDVLLDVCFSADSKRVATINVKHQWGVWNITGEQVGTALQPAAKMGIAFFPDADHLLLGESDALATVDIATGRTVREVPLGSHVNALALRSDGGPIAVAGEGIVWLLGSDATVTATIHATPGDKGRAMQPADPYLRVVRCVTFDDAGRVIFNDGVGVWRWDAKSDQVQGWDFPARTRVAMAGKLAYVLCNNDHVELLDPERPQETDFQITGQSFSLAATRSGSFVAVGFGGTWKSTVYQPVDHADIALLGSESQAAARSRIEWASKPSPLGLPRATINYSVAADVESWQ